METDPRRDPDPLEWLEALTGWRLVPFTVLVLAPPDARETRMLAS